MPKSKKSPSRADLLALLKAYKAFQATAAARRRAWHDVNTDEELKAAAKADSDALELVQKAWIKATSYINSDDRWPLVTEQMVVNLLRDYGLCV